MNPDFRVFDIYLGEPNKGRYLEWSEIGHMLGLANSSDAIEKMMVPLLYQGPYSKEVLLEYTSGRSTLGGNLREGVVVKPTPERENIKGSRTIFKSISEDYLLRKGGTEFN